MTTTLRLRLIFLPLEDEDEEIDATVAYAPATVSTLKGDLYRNNLRLNPIHPWLLGSLALWLVGSLVRRQTATTEPRRELLSSNDCRMQIQ